MPTIKKGIICEDENLQNKIYPYTQMDCVYDSDNSTTLDVVVDDIKENLMYVDEIGAHQGTVPIDADLLNGHDGDYYRDADLLDGNEGAYYENLHMKRLWASSAPNAGYSGGEIVVDTSYKLYYVVLWCSVYDTPADRRAITAIIPRLSDSNQPIKLSFPLCRQGQATIHVTRDVNVSKNGIYFWDEQQYDASGNKGADGKFLVPWLIYGIKSDVA